MKLKRVFTGAVALSAAVLVAGYAMVSSLDVGQVADFAKAEVKSLTGRELTIAGPVKLDISLVPSVDLQDVHFANASWGSRPNMVSLKRLEIEVELLPLLVGEVVVKRLIVVEPDVLLEIDAEGRSNWVFETGGPAVGDAGPGGGGDVEPVSMPDVRDFSIKGGLLTLADEVSGETLRLEITEAVGAVPAEGGARSLRLTAAYNGEPVSVEGTFAGLAALLSAAPAPLDMTLEAGGATVTVKGTAGALVDAPAAEVAVTASGDNLSGLSALLGSDLPALGPYKLSSNVRIENQLVEISQLFLQIGGSDLAGNATLSLAGERPALKATVFSKLLDLADFTAGEVVASEDAVPAAAAGGGERRLFSEDPLPLDGLRAVDAQVKLSADALRLSPTLALDQVEMALSLKGGDLTVEPLVAQLAGGSLDGRFALGAAEVEPSLALALTGSGIDFGKLLEQAEVSDKVGGELDFEVDLKGRGASPHAIASGLEGRAQAVSEEGTIDDALLSALSVGLSEITGPLFGKAEQTRLECFITRFDITQGQAESRALVLDTGAFAIAGRGGIDLAAERVNLAFGTETSEPSLASLAVPFKVVGPLRDPSIVPDPIGAVVGVAGTVGNVAKTGGNLAGSAVNKVGDLLGSGPLVGRIGDGPTLCSQALAAVGRARAPAAKSSGGVVDDVGDAVKGVGEEFEKGLKSLFGN